MLLKMKGQRPITLAVIIGVMLAGLAFLALPDPLQAHAEGKMQLAAVPAGPFKLTVWTSPEPARAGEIHVATTVILGEDASPVLDAAVMVELAALDGSGTVYSGPATTADSSNKFLYEAVFEPADDGLYQVSIAVTGVSGAVGQAAFELEILPASGFNWLLLVPVSLAVAAIVLLWLARRSPAHPGLVNDTESSPKPSG